MNRAQRKYLERQRERKAKQVDNRRKEWNDWVEKMYAAYLKDTKIKASEAVLCHEKEEVSDTKVIDRYWFEHHNERAQIIDTHPDIQLMFSVVQDLVIAYEQYDNNEIHRLTNATAEEYQDAFEPIIEGLNHLQTFIQKYKEASEEEIPELKKLEEEASNE